MKKLLIVDDNTTILLLASELIQLSIRDFCNTPVEIYTASSGEEAIAITSKRVVDLLITDFHMRGITGLELIRTVKAHSHDIVAILMSSDHDLIATLSARPQNGIDALLKKPIEERDLKRILRSFLGDQLGAKCL